MGKRALVRYRRERRWIEITWIPHAMVNDLGREKRMNVMEMERRWDNCFRKKGGWVDHENDFSRLWDTEVIHDVGVVWFSHGDLWVGNKYWCMELIFEIAWKRITLSNKLIIKLYLERKNFIRGLSNSSLISGLRECLD